MIVLVRYYFNVYKLHHSHNGLPLPQPRGGAGLNLSNITERKCLSNW